MKFLRRVVNNLFFDNVMYEALYTQCFPRARGETKSKVTRAGFEPITSCLL